LRIADAPSAEPGSPYVSHPLLSVAGMSLFSSVCADSRTGTATSAQRSAWE